MIESVPFVGEVSGYGSGNVCAVHVMRQVNACAAPRFERALRGAEYVACLGPALPPVGTLVVVQQIKGRPAFVWPPSDGTGGRRRRGSTVR